MNPNKRKHGGQLEINDLIDDAVTNAIARRGFSETLSDDEAARIGGGQLQATELKIDDIAIAGFMPIDPVCPPIKPCEPLIVGLIYPPPGDASELA